MRTQTRADDKTIFAELQNLLVRHDHQRSYASLATVTAWGEFSRVNLSGVSRCECKIICTCHCEICQKWLSRELRCVRIAEVEQLLMHMYAS